MRISRNWGQMRISYKVSLIVERRNFVGGIEAAFGQKLTLAVNYCPFTKLLIG